MTIVDESTQIAGVQFRDHTLLLRALTHRSYLNEHPEETLEDNERLEFLGDAILSLITARYLYNRYPEHREGELTRLRAALVRRETLAFFAEQIDLGEHLLLGRGEEESGGRDRPAILCDVFEAFVGALYLDQGYDTAEAFMQPFIQNALATELSDALHKDPRSELQELTQARFQVTPRYHTVAEQGPDHAKEFLVEVCIGGVSVGHGRGASKQTAAKGAAAHALERVRNAQTIEDLVELPVPAPGQPANLT
jgi:ribonuclease III